MPGTTAEMVERVLDHQVEGAFVCGPVNHPDLVEEVMFREELVLVTARRVQTLQDALSRRDLKIVVLRPAAPIASGSRRCWRAAAWWLCGGSTLGPSTASWAAERGRRHYAAAQERGGRCASRRPRRHPRTAGGRSPGEDRVRPSARWVRVERA